MPPQDSVPASFAAISARCFVGSRAQKELKIEEGHLMPDHVHMLVSIPPKYAVSQVVGFIKGKSAIHLARVYGERKRNFVGQHFWARGFFVNTVGRDEEAIRAYIRNQEKEDRAPRAAQPLALAHATGQHQTSGPRQRPHCRFERLQL